MILPPTNPFGREGARSAPPAAYPFARQTAGEPAAGGLRSSGTSALMTAGLLAVTSESPTTAKLGTKLNRTRSGSASPGNGLSSGNR